MQGAERVNDEFEVGFNQTFEARWYRAEEAGRVVMVLFSLAAALGFMGRGPFSHSSTQSADGRLAVDYEPIARHSTATTITVHVKKPQDATHPVELSLNQQIIEPMGFQRSIPLANTSSVTDNGMRLSFTEPPDQHDVLVRFQVMPEAIGIVPLHVSDGTETVNWSMLVVP